MLLFPDDRWLHDCIPWLLTIASVNQWLWCGGFRAGAGGVALGSPSQETKLPSYLCQIFGQSWWNYPQELYQEQSKCMTTLSDYDNFERFDWKMDQCLEWWDEMATRLMGWDKFANNFDEIVQVSLIRRNWLVVVCWPERFWTRCWVLSSFVL